MLNELESQNDGQVEGILGKVKMLKDVRLPFSVPSSQLPLLLERSCGGLYYLMGTGLMRNR